MRALITGGAGFIGSHLSEYLLDKGYEVLCVDNFLTGSKKNVSHLLENKNFKLLNHDVTKPLFLEEEINVIFHFASPASPIDYQALPIPTLKVGALGTHNMLGLAKEKKAVFVLASTSEVYGDPLEHPQREEYWGNVNPIGPRGVYDEAKRYAEALVMAYHRYHKLDTKIVRIFNTYGPRMRANDGRAVPAFITQALKNEPITVFGDGTQTRSFCYISDLVEGIYRFSISDIHKPVNLGNPQEATVLELAQKIKKIANSDSEISFKQLPIDDPKVRCPDISRAREKLSWEPKINLDDGLTRTIDWFKKEVIK